MRKFLTDERLLRVFTFQALYAGVPPQSALAVYAVIAYMDTVAGVYFPRGGMRALPIPEPNTWAIDLVIKAGIKDAEDECGYFHGTRGRARFTAHAKVQHEPRIVRGQPAEFGGRHFVLAEEFLDRTDQHVISPN